uniref:MgtC/SapB transporter n=1 Tax=uncultured bacterium contig00014 TaxID=1181505 RepID=A0A806KK03_9BACT|nr:MgtC/SapB transporter [uncultured bacterium contig00014]
MIIRLCLGFLAGAVIGFERSSQRQVAGLRTHILIATGATLLMLLSIYLPQVFGSAQRGGDPGRIAAQVVSGIGFLGAGAIIRLGNNVRGLTTAASLWFVAALGLAIGGGMFLVAGLALALGLITLLLLRRIEKKIFPTGPYKLLEISYKDNTPNTKEAMDIIKQSGIMVQSLDINQGSKSKGTKLRLLVRIPSDVDIASIARSIKALGNVGKVEIKEKY